MRKWPSIFFQVACLLLLSDRGATADIPIGGRVIGRAVTDVRVLLEPGTHRREALRRLRNGAVVPPTAARTTADPEGYFELVAPTTGLWTVVVEAPGLPRMEYPLEPLVEPVELPALDLSVAAVVEARTNDSKGWRTGSRPPPRSPTTEPSAPRMLRGQVLDGRDRRPVPGALVWTSEGELAHADDDGRFAIEISTAAPGDLRAAARGYLVGTTWWTDPVTPETPRVLLLPAAAKVSGTVTDETGRPLEDVDITFSRPSLSGVSDPIPRSPEILPRPTRSSRQGRFHAPDLVAGMHHELVFTRKGFAPARIRTGALEAFEHRRGLRVLLATGRRGVGRVVDEQGGGVAGAAITLKGRPALIDDAGHRGTSSPEWISGSDAQGRFTIPDLGSGLYTLEVRAAGHPPAGRSGIRVEPGPGEIDLGTVILSSGTVLSGRVHDLEGKPVDEARIVGWSKAYDKPSNLVEVQTDANGAFTLEDLRPEERIELRVTKRGWSTRILEVKAPPGAGGPLAVKPLEIVLLPVARISGRVLDSEGRPIEGALVKTEVASVYQVASFYQGTRADTTNEAGNFELDSVAPGVVTLSVSASGYAQRDRAEMDAPPGGERSGVEIHLEPSATIEGTLREADGNPVHLARIRVLERRLGLPPRDPAEGASQIAERGGSPRGQRPGVDLA